MLTRNWNPWLELDSLRREVERAFDGLGLSSQTWPLSGWPFFLGPRRVPIRCST